MQTAPNSGEVCAVVAPAETKRAALLFDRVYKWPKFKGTLDFLRFKDPFWSVIEKNCGTDWRVPDELGFGTPDDDVVFQDAWRSFQPSLVRSLSGGELDLFHLEGAIRAVADRYNAAGKSVVVTLEPQDFLRAYQDRLAMCYKAVLNEVPVVCTDETPWDQIVDFRRNTEAVRKYRDLRHWLRRGLEADSVEEAQEIVSIKLDAYKDAVREHGFKVLVGAIEQVFEWQPATIVTGATTVAALCGGHVWAALIGGLFFGAHVSLYVARGFAEFDALEKGQHKDIAVLFDINDQFKDTRS